ncbi:MAG: ATP-binding cassette domain-containing protein, partial [Deltaproteobacteria bacterium]|nr:ATP-binding cassette domain-containing protein [Deltaproteobacteria bacterium]
LKNLTTIYPTRRGEVPAVHRVSLKIGQGEILGLVGESGCGKSTVLLSILRLIRPPGSITEGEILFQGQNLLHLPSRELRSLRGKEIAMIFQ